MRIHWSATCLLATCTAAVAQTPVVSPNSIYTYSEGSGVSTHFGAYASARHQLIDGNFHGKSMLLKGLSYRLDHRWFDADSGMGRSWTRVSIDMSDGKLSSFGSTYSSNVLSTPSRVFDATMSWPSKVGASAALPAAWSVKVPFTSAWTYSGKSDILTDYRFSGGSLTNSATWTSGKAVPYHLDSFGTGSFANGPSVTLGKIVGGCTAGSSARGASLHVLSSSYGPNFPVSGLRDKFTVEARGFDFPPRTPVVLALAFLAWVDGLPLGAPCNQLYLDSRRTFFYHPRVSNVDGSLPPIYFGVPGGVAAYSKLIASYGINLVAQVGWDDLPSNSLKLSSASRSCLVPLPPYLKATDTELKTAYGHSVFGTTANVLSIGESTAIPIVRYAN